MINRAGLGIACALAAAALYGFVPNMVRAGFENGVPPVESTFFRTATVGIVFAVIANILFQGESLHWNHFAAFLCLRCVSGAGAARADDHFGRVGRQGGRCQRTRASRQDQVRLHSSSFSKS